MRRRCVSVLVLAGACGGARISADLSAAEHRQAADREYALAQESLADYEPAVREAIAMTELDHGGVMEQCLPVAMYNPGDSHLRAAEVHLRLALGHEQAAAELEHAMAKECAAQAPEPHAQYPILTDVAAVKDIEHGVRLELAPGASADMVLADLRCHIAYARVHGLHAGSCPLFAKGVKIARVPDAAVVEVTAENRLIRDGLRAWARAQLKP